MRWFRSRSNQERKRPRLRKNATHDTPKQRKHRYPTRLFLCFRSPNSICLNAMVRAYGRARQLRQARAFVDTFPMYKVVPDKFTFTALLWACGYAGKWEEAEEVFGQMKRIGCCPDGVTYTTWINTLERNGKWEEALEVFENMRP